MMEVGREHVAVDDLRSSSKERDDEKIPPCPLCQSGEFETGMPKGKILLSSWAVRAGHRSFAGGSG
jgi:hypothetical protein